MNKLVKDALVLTCITLVAGFALGLVYEITKAPIEKAHQDAMKEAYSSVFADAASFAEMENFDSSAATVTSRAMTGGINACVTYFESIVGGASNE